MPWGRFVYHVQKTKIVQPTDFSVLDKRSYDRLVMSACHPLHSAANRIIVFSRFVRREHSRVKRRR
jgi:sortase A